MEDLWQQAQLGFVYSQTFVRHPERSEGSPVLAQRQIMEIPRYARDHVVTFKVIKL